MYKAKQFSLDEDIPPTEGGTTTLKNNFNIKNTDLEFVCETCGLTLPNKNDLTAHLKMHNGNE